MKLKKRHHLKEEGAPKYEEKSSNYQRKELKANKVREIGKFVVHF